jgi:rubrerythrin
MNPIVLVIAPVLIIPITIQISFEFTLATISIGMVVAAILKYVHNKAKSQQISSAGYGGSTYQINYNCMSCGTKHNQSSCPSCGSKMKRVGS